MNEAAPQETSALEERLVALIRAHGPISVADYMEDALFHPHDGYYTSQAPIGADGDFTTAPEISQIFGELIGAWLIESWKAMGAPGSFNLVELGPGRGVMIADILRAAQLRPDFQKGAHVWLVETSGRLRHEQQRRLKNAGAPIDWADNFTKVPSGPTLVVANEFLDCLPIRQFVRAGASWRERQVGLDAGGAALAFTLSDTPPPPSIALPDPQDAQEGDIFEIGEAGEALIDEVARVLTAHGGRALFIDYGHVHDGFGDTLQAVRRHAFWPPLVAPGKADLTAHVNFERLARAAFAAGAAAHGPVSQGRFLEQLGLSLRVERLALAAPDRAAEIRLGAHRIASPGAMGELFKAACVSSPGLPDPPGFQ
jgi:NADH dehydrogenase [ubiquinone] 1 alpha subcomplex assembly factor 7